VVPLGFSMDTVGPIARSARCCAQLLEVLAGPDAGDPAGAEEPVPRYSHALSGSLDGMRLGVDRANHLDRPGAAPELSERLGDYGVHTAKVLAAGLLLSSADYVQAQRVRAWARREVAALLDSVEAIVTPTAGVGAPLLAGLDHLSFGRLPIFAGFWNAIGFPAIAVPMGTTEAARGVPALPLSLQIAGRPFDEATVLRVADAYQQRTAWHRQLPPLVA
jgi:aspartyl-tRNA(Asn)/glutamyl-tRNA(Gln) amidotransferase subunit A